MMFDFEPLRNGLQSERRVDKPSHHGRGAMASLTIENYVKTIYQLCAGNSHAPALTGRVAAALGVSPGSVTSMLKTLSDSGLAVYTPYEGVRLTDAGHLLALRVVRRHRLIELFLAQTLQLAWDEVHDEAENMEHAVSDLLVDRIDAFLGYPRFDPHGDPIPGADGSLPGAVGMPLAEWPVDTPFELIRVLDQSPSFLRYLHEVGLPLGAVARVVAHRPAAGLIQVGLLQVGPVQVGLDQAIIDLASTTATKLHVAAIRDAQGDRGREGVSLPSRSLPPAVSGITEPQP
jgi:DtxR family Mn-dependent transcriptional regulator